MEEGKLDISLLHEILRKKGHTNNGIISSGEVGTDAASLDITLAQRKAQEYYDNYSNPYLIVKSDPVTFPTSKPGRYAVIINANDIACTGAIPYGFLATIILPPSSTFEDIQDIQNQIHQQCLDLEISLLGGHTEFSDAVNRIVVSGNMFGFVPKEYYVPNVMDVDSSIIIAGEIGAESIGIIISEAGETIRKVLDESELEQGIIIGNRLSLADIATLVNRKFQPTLIHDATEGGLYGALGELLLHKKVGILLEKEPEIHPILSKLSEWLKFNPYRIISSGLIIFIVSKDKTEPLLEFLAEYQIPSSKIGLVTSEEGILRLGNRIIDKPKGDEIITALKNLERFKNEIE